MRGRKKRLRSVVLVLIFLALAAGIIFAGALYYRNYKQSYRLQAARQLSAIADLKMGMLTQWRKERLGDAAVFYRNPVFSALVRRYIEQPENPELQKELRTWMNHVQASSQYDRLMLLDLLYAKILIVPDGPERSTSFVSPGSSEDLRSGKVVFEDFTWNEENQRIYLKVLVPILDEAQGDRVLGILALRIDPEMYLYPLINLWPIPSRTAETLLVRREGNEALYLNSLKYQKNAALHLRIPLGRTDVPAVEAVLGNEGVVEGVDYRGAPVVSALRPIPDSPWFLVAKMDASEAFGPMKARLWEIAAIAAVLLLGLGAVLGYFWRRQRIRLYRERYLVSEALGESEERFRRITESSHEAIMTLEPPSWKFASGNPATVALFRAKDAREFLSHGPGDLSPERQPDGRSSVEKSKEMIDTALREGSCFFEWTHARTDGSEFPTTVLLTRMQHAGKTILQATVRDITEQKQAEEELRFKNVILSTQQEMSPDGIHVVDPKGNMISWNQRFIDMWGIPSNVLELRSSELAIKSILDKLADPEQFLAEVRRLYVDINATTHDELALKDGRVFDRHSAPLIGKEGRFYGRVWYFRDITEEKRAEEMLRKSEERFRLIFDNAIDGVLLISLDNQKIDSANKSMSQMLGYPLEELKKLGSADIHPQEDLSYVDKQIEIQSNDGLAPARDLPMRRKDGSVFYANVRGAPIVLSGKKYLMGIFRDITEQRRADEERTRTLHRQQGINELQQSLLAPATLGAKLKIITDGIVRIFGADFCRIWLIRPGDLCEQGCIHALVREGPHVCRFRDRCLHLLASSGRYTHLDGLGHRRVPFDCYKIGRIASGQEPRFLINDAVNDPNVHNHDWARELGLVSFAGYRLQVPGAETQGVLALFADHPISAGEDAKLGGLSSAVSLVVQQAAAEEDLRRAIAEKEEANRLLKAAVEQANQLAIEAQAANIAKGQFLANMSHEIRTPMNGVIGMSELLMATELSAEQRRFAESVRSSGEALLSVINDILDFSKIESDKLDLEELDFDIRATLEDVAELLSLRAHEKNLEFIYRVDPQVQTFVRGDPGRLRQILINLGNNAIKFTARGEVTVEVRPESETDGQIMIRFEVRDTGIGIPRDRIGLLFTAFQQVDASTTRLFGGTGLGLAISKRLAERMGGEIGVASVAGQGSTFWFTAVFGKQARRGRLDGLRPADLRGARILAVDDNATNRLILAEQLASWGVRLAEAESAARAIEWLRAALAEGDPFRIVITDMQMPETDGESLGRAIKADPVLADTNLVMMSSFGRRGDAKRLKDIGFSAYLTKPVKQSQLFDCLAAVLGGDPKSIPAPDAELVTRHTLNETRRRNIRILLAEDNPTNRQVALGMLANLGFKADTAADGREVLQALKTARYDIVLMDVQMPEMDGFEATRAIRSGKTGVFNPRIPIIAMTAHAMKGDRELCLEAGIDDYISKPIAPQALAAALEKWIDKTPERRSGSPAPGGKIPPPASRPVFDRPALLDRLMGDAVLAKDILAIFLEDIPKQLQLLKELVDRGAAESAGSQAHAIKGAAANVGGMAFSAVAGDMEKAGKAGRLDEVAALLPELKRQFDLLQARMESATP
jgi:PAS domain S-box-containing protein